jgi:hypothetical protein
MKRALYPMSMLALLFAICEANAQQAFKTPDDAASALVSAVRTDDLKALTTVLGPDGEDIMSSGDPVADAATRDKFLEAYNARHEIAVDGDKATMVIGEEAYPLPIPLVRRDGQWRFDTAAGRDEILYRRIGRNELEAVQASLAYVDAQREYAEKDRTGAGINTYAQRIVSQPGKKDGLYWPAEQGEDPSPLGELVAEATSQGYQVGGGERKPFHGYLFKILTRQGPAARGGEYDYIINGKMIGGFALVAYPAEYGNSGVMTFLVNHDGTVFEKDLGPDTAKIAERMSAFNPDKGWQKVGDTEP